MKRTTIAHTKLKRLKRRLQIREYQAVGILEMLWLLTSREAPHGDIGRLENEDIAAFMEWEGDEDELIAALVASRWLDEHPEHRLLVHHWPDHCDNHVHAALAKRIEVFADGTPPQIPSTAFNSDTRNRIKAEYKQKFGLAPDEFRTSPGQVRAKPEPEPEPKPEPGPGAESESPNGDSCAEPPAADAAPPDPPVLTFPTKGKPDRWHLRQSRLDEYRGVYTDIDVETEVRKALQWVRDTPSKRKTASGMAAFLTRWLNRATEKGGAPPRASPRDMSRKKLASMEKRLGGLLLEHRSGGRSRKAFAHDLVAKRLSESERNDTAITRLLEQFDHPPGGQRSMNAEGTL